MDPIANVWMIAILGFAAGIAVGALIYHFTKSDSQAQQKAESRLDDLSMEYRQYQHSVSQHFARTAELVNNLTESYRDVHAHLSSGAHELCGGDEGLRRQIESSLANRLLEREEEPEAAEQPAAPEHEYVEPPRDYAPKTADQEGTLSASFGLKARKGDQEEPEK